MMIAPKMIDELAHMARTASTRAYAPYSHYPVGAAALSASGKIYTGCNIENASYGLTVCAERVAVWAAVAAGEREIVAVAVSTPNGATPCGACRQVLAEFGPAGKGAEREMLVIMVTSKGNQIMPLSELLPHAFLPKHLSGE
jgi:cytidine deaminase